MSLRRLAIIGCGGIAEIAVAALREQLAQPLAHVCVLCPPEFIAKAQDLLDRAGERLATKRSVLTDLGGLLADPPEVVAECASHAAVAQYGPSVLAAGIHLIISSIGALADDRLWTALQTSAQAAGSRIVLPAGAIGGVDALVAARLSGLESVVYSGRKPPEAWRGTAAERIVDLDRLSGATVFYEGTARDAARDYPLNANVAATLALAGIGFEQTRVRLIADPGTTRNVHEFEVHAACGDFTVRLEGRPSAANPKTSMMAGYSVARELLNFVGPVMM